MVKLTSWSAIVEIKLLTFLLVCNCTIYLTDPCEATEEGPICHVETEECQKDPFNSMKVMCVCKPGYQEIAGHCLSSLEELISEVHKGHNV